MDPFFALLATFLGGVVAGALVNWAAYTLAWFPRAISPWSARRASDRLPIWGWLGLRREAALHGAGFWRRPLFVELAMGVGFVALWWWEVERQGLIAGQFAALAGGPLPVGMLLAPKWITYATLGSHALLLTLMMAASLIDFDEKTIPDAITIPGTLLGLILAAAVPMSLLPFAAVRPAAPPAGVTVPLPEGVPLKTGALYVEPTTFAAPNEWIDRFGPAPRWRGLAVGLACYALWCFSLSERIWRTRRGRLYGLQLLLARVARDLARPPLLWFELAGFTAIAAVWYVGGPAWVGLLTALVGMIGASASVWIIRIIATHALHKEAMGFGDVTLMMMIGAFVGWQAGLIIFFVAPFTSLLVAVTQYLIWRTNEIYFGPFLCFAAAVVVAGWATVWNINVGPLHLFYESWLVLGVLGTGIMIMWPMLVVWRIIKEAIFGPPDD
jgi:leader peptidase (prepilin peptidase)/N-methyltransferase